MPDFNAAEFGRRIDAAKTVASVTEIFNDVAALAPAQQREAVNAMETVLVNDWLKSAPRGADLAQIRMVLDIVEEMKGTPEGDAMLAEFERHMPNDEVGRVSSLSINGVAKYKGDEAHPLVKLFVEEEAKQLASEADTPFGIAKLMVAVQERYVAEQPQTKPATRPNPFRKPGGNFDL